MKLRNNDPEWLTFIVYFIDNEVDAEGIASAKLRKTLNLMTLPIGATQLAKLKW